MNDGFDILLRNGSVADGGGGPARRADVAIAGGRIAAVGLLPAGARAEVVLDAAGLTVCPGFIDAHSHSDVYLLVEPDAPSKLRQGVTTEVVGQCGCSAAPLRGLARHDSDWQAVLTARGMAHAAGEAGCWSSVAAYRERLAANGHAPNVVCLVGHNTLRAGVTGYAGRAASRAECAAMARLLAEALDEGASGLSTGLIYTPGLFSEPDEVLALARVAAARGALYATHMRSEGDRLLEAIDEVLELARRTGIRTQISHLKTAGRANWSKLDAALERIGTARAQGLQVHADRYPYVASGTALDSRLPAWAQAGGNDAILERLRDPATATRLARELAESTDPAYWDGVMIGGTRDPGLRRFRGATVTAVARDFGCDPVAAYLRLLLQDNLSTQAFFFGMAEENMRRIYAEPWVMVGSDASIRSVTGPLSADHPHPRAFGAFARFLRLALDGAIGLSLEEAIRRMTSLPAEALGLRDRGWLRPGAWADIAVFDAARVRDLATYAAPHHYAEGVRWTIVNGQIAFDGLRARARPGRWLLAGARG